MYITVYIHLGIYCSENALSLMSIFYLPDVFFLLGRWCCVLGIFLGLVIFLLRFMCFFLMFVHILVTFVALFY